MLIHPAYHFSGHGPGTSDVCFYDLSIRFVGSELVFYWRHPGTVDQPVDISWNAVDKGFADSYVGDVSVWRAPNVGVSLQFGWSVRGDVDGVDIGSKSYEALHDGQSNARKATLLAQEPSCQWGGILSRNRPGQRDAQLPQQPFQKIYSPWLLFTSFRE